MVLHDKVLSHFSIFSGVRFFAYAQKPQKINLRFLYFSVKNNRETREVFSYLINSVNAVPQVSVNTVFRKKLAV